MADNASLLRQLANRAKRFHSQTGITQSKMARALGMTDGNYSGFLSGRKGIGSEATCFLLKYTAMSPSQAVAAFSKPVFSASIMSLQENGKKLHFSNDGWIPNENSTDDPARSGTDITSTPRARTQQVADLTAVFQDLDYVTRKNVIDSFIAAHSVSNTIPTTQKFKRKG
jgi:transcriptional regulator with XRE-family HTH domain